MRTNRTVVHTINAAESLRKHCKFGSLPGSLNLSARVGSRWTLFDPNCPLHNYLDPYSELKPARFIFFSDKGDIYLCRMLCELYQGRWIPLRMRDNQTVTFACFNTKGLYLMWSEVPNSISFLSRGSQQLVALASTWDEYSPLAPQIVVLSLETPIDAGLYGEVLSQRSVLLSWLFSLEQEFVSAKLAFSQAGLFVYHTTLELSIAYTVGSQLNSVGEQAAILAKYDTVDYNQVLRSFSEDTVSQNVSNTLSVIGFELWNLYLNYASTL